MDNAKQRADGCTGAVCILTAVDCSAKALIEVTLAIQQAQNDNTDVIGSIHTGCAGRQILRQVGLLGKANAEGSGELGEQLEAGLLPVLTSIVAAFYQANRLSGQTVLRNVGKADPDQLTQIGHCKSGTLHSCNKHSGENAFVRMIDNGIFVGIASRDLGMTGCHTGPQLCTDPGAVAVLIGVIYVAAKRGLHAAAQVPLAHAVLGPVGVNISDPVICQDLCIDTLAILFCCIEPDQLQVKIIVSGRVAVNILQIEMHIVHHSRILFVGAAQNAAYVFAVPATEDLISEFCIGNIHVHSSFCLCYDTLIITDKNLSL